MKVCVWGNSWGDALCHGGAAGGGGVSDDADVEKNGVSAVSGGVCH